MDNSQAADMVEVHLKAGSAAHIMDHSQSVADMVESAAGMEVHLEERLAAHVMN